MSGRRSIVPSLIAAAGLLPFVPALFTGEVFLLRDHLTYFLPLRWFTAQSLRAGELPLWNAFNGSGEAWLANPQTAVFYPPALLLFVLLPFAAAYVLYLALHVAVLGLGAFFLFRRWASEGPAAVGAVALMLSGPVMSMLDTSNNLTSFAWIPWVAWLALRVREGERVSVALTFTLAFSFLGGEPFFAAIAAAVCAAILASGRKWTALAAAAAGSAGLCAVQLLPFLSLLRGSERLVSAGAAQPLPNSLAPADWITLAISSASISGSLEPMRLSQSFMPSLFITLPVVALAVAAALDSARSENRERQKLVAVLVALLGLTLFVAAGSAFSLSELLWRTLRLDVVRYPARLAPFGALLVAALAAVGLERVRRTPRATRLGVLLAIFIVAGVRLVAFESIEQPAGSLRFGLFLASALIFGTIWILFPRWLEHKGGRSALAAVIGIELWFAAVPFLESGAFAPPRTTWTLPEQKKFARVAAPQDGLSHPYAQAPRTWKAGYLNLYDRVFDAESPAPVMEARYAGLLQEALRTPRLDLLNLFSIGALITDRPLVAPGLRLAQTQGTIALYHNDRAFPLAVLWSSGVRTTPQQGDQAASEPPVEADRSLFLLGEVQRSAPGAAVAAGVVSKVTGDAIEVVVDAPQEGVLVLSQRWEPGWDVIVNGRQRPSLLAQSLFLAVEVERGRNEVRWRYGPQHVYAGALISVLTIVLVIAITVRTRLRARRLARVGSASQDLP